MTSKTEMCPETPDILSAAGLDVTALNYTVSLLCDNRQRESNTAASSISLVQLAHQIIFRQYKIT